MDVDEVCLHLEGHRALHPMASRELVRHLVETILALVGAQEEQHQ